MVAAYSRRSTLATEQFAIVPARRHALLVVALHHWLHAPRAALRSQPALRDVSVA